MSARRPMPKPNVATVRCAVYTRVSTEENLGQAFNSLHAQREAAEAYVKSQAHEGWTLVPEAYDDGGFTGGNIDRPALRRLLADIEAGQIDMVIVHKVDRLSRSLLDFAKLMEVFERKHVAFVSVTQLINSANSMGRLMLNVLLSFAQFEREIIGERTRDKIAAARRKGKWAGGRPLLGYDIDPKATRLLVNEREAVQVREIFQLYLEKQSLLPVVAELETRGWTTKRWTTKDGAPQGGKPILKNRLHLLLTNPAYAGLVRHKDETYPGEHAAIVEPEVFRKVQALLSRNGRTGGSLVRNKFGFLLKGLLKCKACGCAMGPSTTQRKTKVFRYYICRNAQARGWDQCPAPSLPAGAIEEFVLEEIRGIGADPSLHQEVLGAARRQQEARKAELEREERGLVKDLLRWEAEIKDLAGQLGSAPATARLADLQERLRGAEARAKQVRTELQVTGRERVSAEQVAAALAAFGPVWATLTAAEQARLLELLIERVEHDGGGGKIAIKFRDTSLQGLGAK